MEIEGGVGKHQLLGGVGGVESGEDGSENVGVAGRDGGDATYAYPSWLSFLLSSSRSRFSL